MKLETIIELLANIPAHLHPSTQVRTFRDGRQVELFAVDWLSDKVWFVTHDHKTKDTTNLVRTISEHFPALVTAEKNEWWILRAMRMI